MTLTTYNPFDLEIDRLLDDAYRTLGHKAAAWLPRYNAWEDKEFQEAVKKAKETPDEGRPMRDFDLD